MITNFINNNTVITASWLNKVDRAVSNAIGQGTDAPTTPAQVKQNLGLDNVDNTSDLNSQLVLPHKQHLILNKTLYHPKLVIVVNT